MGTYLGVLHARDEAIFIQVTSCWAIRKVEARKRSGRLILLTIPHGIIPFAENILLDPVDDADI